MLLALKMEEGAMSQRMQKASRSWRRQGNRFSLKALEEPVQSIPNTGFMARLLRYTSWLFCILPL